MGDKALYKPGMIVEDLRCRSLSALARGLFAVLQAVCNGAAGRLCIGGRGVTPEAAAQACGFDVDAAGLLVELVEMGLLAEDDHGWFMPDQVAAAALREKRRRAGRKGGVATTTARAAHGEDVCLSNVVSFVESKAKAEHVKKEKRTKKEKNNNYIYILGTKVFVGDAGSADNPDWWSSGAISLCRRAFEALQQAFGLSSDELTDILVAQANWLEGQAPSMRANWLAVTIRHLQNITGQGRAADDRGAA